MNEPHSKSLTFQLTRQIFIVYLALAISLTSLQVYMAYDIVIAHAPFSILLIFTGLALTTIGVWVSISFFTHRFLTIPLQRFIEQLKSFNYAETMPTPEFDLGSTPARELIELREACGVLVNSVASKQLAMQQEVTEAVSLAKSRFLSAASHDLRQPMHALNLYLAALAKDEMSKSVQAGVENVNKCAKAMNDMLDTLLEISNIDAGATQAQFSIFPIASPIDRIQNEFEPLARMKGLTLRIARCSAFVYADEEIVERVLRLLVSNAVRYTERGKILIGCRQRGEQLCIAVYDTGLGIAPDQQQAIFQEQFQLNNYERNRAKGLGLGLAIVQRLVKLLKTTIKLDSKPGLGSQFSFDLPRIDLDSIQPVTLQNNLCEISNHQGPIDVTIAVIDDEPLILDATCSLLEGWGYKVITAPSGREMIKQLTNNFCMPDMIICDYLLEGNQKGVTIIASLREMFHKAIPAMLVTGITSSEHIEAIHRSGFPYMFKPLNEDKLRETIAQSIPTQ